MKHVLKVVKILKDVIRTFIYSVSCCNLIFIHVKLNLASVLIRFIDYSRTYKGPKTHKPQQKSLDIGKVD